MIKRLTLSYLIASILTILVIMVEIGLRSPLLSPFLLFDHSSSFQGQKVITGYSALQGEDYLLLTQSKNSESFFNRDEPLSMNFDLGKTSYSFYEIKQNREDKEIVVDLPSNDENKIDIITRKGIVPVSEQTLVKNEVSNLLVNHYTLEMDKGTINVKLQFEYSVFWIAITLLFSILFPALLFLFYRYQVKKGGNMENIFIIFLPYALSVLLPVLLNYFYLLSFVLLETNSFLLSILLAILLPSILCIFITIKSGDYYSKAIVQQKKEEKTYYQPSVNDNDFISGKEKRKFIILVTLALCYMTVYLLIPINLQSLVINNLFNFMLWYLSLTAIIFIFFFFLHQYSGDYRVLEKKHKLNTYVKEISQKVGLNIKVLIKQNSREDVNAWVYSLKLLPSKETLIYMTEGLLERFSEEEIKTIIYHELGHVKQKHGKYILYLTFLVTIAVSILMFFLRQIMLANGWWLYLAAFPIGVLALILVAEWLPKKVSKMFEHKADAYVIEQTNEKELYIHSLRKLTEYSEYENNHSRKKRDWNKTHPTLQKRINFIERTFRN